MWPALSHTKPVPVPLGTCCTRVENMSRCAASEVMCTTDGEVFLKMSMWACSSAASAPRGVMARGTASVRLSTSAGATRKASSAAPVTSPAAVSSLKGRRRRARGSARKAPRGLVLGSGWEACIEVSAMRQVTGTPA